LPRIQGMRAPRAKQDPRAPEAIVKETGVACGHHHRVGPHTEGTTQVPIRYSAGRKVAGNTSAAIRTLRTASGGGCRATAKIEPFASTRYYLFADRP